jgi:POT family proton-dependent oligopeptide transporter
LRKDEKTVPINGTENPETTHSSVDVEKSGLKHETGYDDSESGSQVLPTDEERQSLRRVSDKIPLKAYTIAFVELVERLSYYGTTAV